MIEAYLVVSQTHHRILRTVTSSERVRSIPIVLDYLAEGGANVVYRIITLRAGASIPVPSELQGKLLRLRKDKPFITGTQEQHGIFIDTFASLFMPEQLVEQSLVSVDRNILNAVNDDLKYLETAGYRLKLRHDDQVATEEQFGLLLTDMTAYGADVLLELKPKWLLQSPNAPAGAVRCRTCALRALRNFGNGRGETVPKGLDLCPLSLIEQDMVKKERGADAIVTANGALLGPDAGNDLAGLLASSAAESLLMTIKRLQAALDPKGILSIEPDGRPSQDFLKAMTLRDCTLFIRCKNGSLDPSSVELRLTDLDLKQAHPDKVEKWRRTEQDLVDDGWYMNTEDSAIPETICSLSNGP